MPLRVLRLTHSLATSTNVIASNHPLFKSRLSPLTLRISHVRHQQQPLYFATMSLSLKHIPCPAGPNCTAYLCLFGHESKTAPAVGTDSKAGQAGQAGQRSTDTVMLDDDGGEDATRKRTKVDSPQTAAAQQMTASINTRQPSHTGGHTPSAPSQLPSRRPISPPAKKPAASAPKAKPAPKPEKKESLNPRLLKHSPASHEIRLRLVRMVHQEYKRLNEELSKDAKPEEKRLLLSDQQLITRVLDEEEAVAVGRASVYSNVMKNNVMKYKRLKVGEWVKEREKEVPAAGKKRPHGEMENAVVIETGLTPAQEVQLLQRITTPIDTLGAHGYVSSVPTDDMISKARDGLDTAMGWEKCDRCDQRFQVFVGRRAEDGALSSGGACNFHWGKAYFPDKLPGDRTKQPKRYLCCGQQIGDSAGCITHPNHVFKASDPKRLAAVLNYASTPENDAVPKDRAVCFDCEMGYTVHGMELIRLTATSWPDGDEILDILVKPLGEILDLNSRYSGVWPDDLAQAAEWQPGDALVPDKSSDGESGSEDGQLAKRKLKAVSSPAAARELLFSLLSPTTPLIGHGLENDLNAVRIVHPTLIDTVLAFPHKGGLPFRYSLKGLMSTHLNRKIQVQTGPRMLGHDSAEDARAAGELVRFKVAKEWADMKRAGWRVVDGEIVSPVANDGASADDSGGLTERFIES